jgi:hypothetical protein
MENQDDANKKKKEGRSPGYPAIDLETAIKRAGQIKEEEQRHFAPLDAVVKHWGYSSQSGPFLGTLSALIKYGLLETKGKGKDRQVRITDLAWRILIDDRETSPERRKALKEAALNPAIHRKLWDRYEGDFPSVETFRILLLTEYKFMESAVKEFMREFERTIFYAKLDEHDILSGLEEDKKPPAKETFMPDLFSARSSSKPQTTEKVVSDPEMGTISFQLSPQKWVKVELPYQLNEAEWKRIIETLDVFKPGFVKEALEPNEGDE